MSRWGDTSSWRLTDWTWLMTFIGVLVWMANVNLDSLGIWRCLAGWGAITLVLWLIIAIRAIVSTIIWWRKRKSMRTHR